MWVLEVEVELFVVVSPPRIKAPRAPRLSRLIADQFAKLCAALNPGVAAAIGTPPRRPILARRKTFRFSAMNQ
jgi:hypothetical protein